MNGVRVIQLGPAPSPSQSVSFEEAFGEFSELRGKGRARRAARKQDKIQKRKERRLARVSARDEVQSARQDSRISRRSRRKAGRQAIRSEQQGARQARKDERNVRRMGRRTFRTEGRQNLKDIRNPEEAPIEEGLDTGVDQEMGSNEAYSSQPETGYQEQPETGGYAPEESSSQEEWGGGYNTSAGWGEDTQDVETPYDYGNEEPYEGESYQEDSFVEDGDYLGEYQASEDDVPFDGVMGAEDRYSELSDSKSINVDPHVQDIVNKLIWNQELVSRLEEKRKSTKGNPQEISRKIIERKKRIVELQKQLEDFSNCCGQYSNADGSEETMRNRGMQVSKAKHIANRERMMVRKGNAGAKQMHGQMAHSRRVRHGGGVTPVSPDLRPRFGHNRIEVPSKSNATGLNGIDLEEDFDAPRTREIYLGVDGGSTNSINWGSILIGVGLGVAGIWAAKKYNLLK